MMITLTTDFGDTEYVGAMKGVIYSINSDAKIVDITHNIRPFNIRHGAYAIYSTFSYFPQGSVHVVVVDPGVGTSRKGIILESKGNFFVGPDNGVFSLIDPEKIFEITENTKASATFHGRDIFARVAAKIDSGTSPAELGAEIKGYKKIMKKQVKTGDTIKGEVFCADRFGNIITSLRTEHLEKAGLHLGGTVNLILGRRKLKVPFVKTYGELREGVIGALINSSGHFEITIREGSAEKQLEISGGEPVEVFPP